MLRNDFLSRQKQWEMEQARSAPVAPGAPEDEMDFGIQCGARPGEDSTRYVVSNAG